MENPIDLDVCCKIDDAHSFFDSVAWLARSIGFLLSSCRLDRSTHPTYNRLLP